MQAIKTFFLPQGAVFHTDFLSGLTVALALIPEAIAFALVAHVNPLVGLYAAFFMCTITALIGGRPGMISGATGSMAVVMVALVATYGINYLFAAVILTGILQIIIGLLRLGKLIRMLPKSVMVGFVNGLAVVIFLAQLNQFKVIGADGARHWLQGSPLYIMIALVLLAMAITHYLPTLTKAIPSALTAIVVVSLIALFGVHTRIVSDMLGSQAMAVSLPKFSWPHVAMNLHTLFIVGPYAVVLAIIGLSESLMTLSLIDERTQTHGRGNKECLGQGIANIVSGFFQSMGGCAMIGQSMINITSGGRGRLSGIVAGVFLFLFILVLWPFIKMIPLAALVGVVVASLVFAWQSAKNIYSDAHILDTDSKEYILHGPLFFGSSAQFKTLFTPEKDPKNVIIDFKYSRVADHSAIDAIKFVSDKYQQHAINLHLRHLSLECKRLLGRAGSMVEVNVLEDPNYHVATDELE